VLVTEGVECALAFVSPDVVWHAFPQLVDESEFRGHDGVRRMAAMFPDSVEDFEMRVEEFRDCGDRVVELWTMSGRIKGSTGPRVRQQFAIVLSNFRDGMIGEGRNFSTWREALEFAGLRE
jgi:ketosteroid isomerase-like protein